LSPIAAQALKTIRIRHAEIPVDWDLAMRVTFSSGGIFCHTSAAIAADSGEGFFLATENITLFRLEISLTY
jgi:hypothetical protein